MDRYRDGRTPDRLYGYAAVTITPAEAGVWAVYGCHPQHFAVDQRPAIGGEYPQLVLDVPGPGNHSRHRHRLRVGLDHQIGYAPAGSRLAEQACHRSVRGNAALDLDQFHYRRGFRSASVVVQADRIF